MNKPSIVSVIGERVDLRRAGKEFVGCCPLHADKTPSFTVSEAKQVFFCHGCHEGGDVISFIQKLDGLTFPEALRVLGIESNGRRPAPKVSPNRKAATLLAGWLNDQYLLIGARCREVSREIALAEEINDPELVESLTLEWELLSDLHDDLANPAYAAELWESREFIESLTAGVELEPIDPLLPLTDEYIERLENIIRC
jgi:CHC2 zinc finger